MSQLLQSDVVEVVQTVVIMGQLVWVAFLIRGRNRRIDRAVAERDEAVRVVTERLERQQKLLNKFEYLIANLLMIEHGEIPPHDKLVENGDPTEEMYKGGESIERLPDKE